MIEAVLQGYGEAVATILPSEAFHKQGKAVAFQAGQQEEEALTTAGLHCGIQPHPLVAVCDYPGRANPPGTSPAPVPALEPTARLVHGKGTLNSLGHQGGSEVLFIDPCGVKGTGEMD
jgi:hypothetical protein